MNNSLDSYKPAAPDTPRASIPREHCRGVVPLDAVIASWMIPWLSSWHLLELVKQWESPLNVLSCVPFRENVEAILSVARERGLAFRPYFARKANKCLSFVDEAIHLGIGIDTASEIELTQSLERGADSSQLICTAAIKSDRLMSLCTKNRVAVVIDNADEWDSLSCVANSLQAIAKGAIRISGFSFEGKKLYSRFGFDIDALRGQLAEQKSKHLDTSIEIEGLQFHLDSHSLEHRVAAITQSLTLVDQLRCDGFPIKYLDIGGGIPVNYVSSESQWSAFWHEHKQAMLGKREEITFRNHTLGKKVNGTEVFGVPNVYPCWQKPAKESWLAEILDSELLERSHRRTSVADAIRLRGLELRCEPGRSLLDGCGMTIARVEYRKKHVERYHLIGLSMNRTQCRTTHDDFLVDPILIQSPCRNGVRSKKPMEGYLVGAYCTEMEQLSLRRMFFPTGVERGDLVVFPNTAGYLMHFMESRSHQFPLAKNLFVQPAQAMQTRLDDLDFWDHRFISIPNVPPTKTTS